MRKMLLVAVCLSFAWVVPDAEASHRDNIVQSVILAPVAPDGDVMGHPLDVVINLDRSLNPAVAGRALLKGNSIRIVLPRPYRLNDPTFPVDTLGSPTCLVGCSTVALLQGWPQHPIGFPPPTIPDKWKVELKGRRTLVITALQDLIPAPPQEPGIKQLHLLMLGFINPRPGNYPIRIEAETGNHGRTEKGVAILQIRRRPRASISVTSVFNMGSPNTIYQQAGVGQPAPLNYDFLLWDRNGAPAIEVVIDGGRLVQGAATTIGTVRIEAPNGASGQVVKSLGPSTEIPAPITGVPTARLTALFNAGSEPGLYVVKFRLFGGNTQRMFVNVRP